MHELLIAAWVGCVNCPLCVSLNSYLTANQQKLIQNGCSKY